MRSLKRVAAVLYLLVCAFVLGTLVLSLVGPAQDRVAELLEARAFRIALYLCAGIVAAQALYVLGRALFVRPEPRSVHPDANPNIEVTLSAVQAVARASAQDADVMVEDVNVSASRRRPAWACVRIDAIALVDQDLNGLAHRMQQRVTDACERMLGCPGVEVSVRFFPSKTVTVTREVSDER